MTETLIRRLMSASHGHVAVDVAACPEWGYETVTFPARGTWSPALQSMIPHEIGGEFGSCSACGRAAVEEVLFLSPGSLFSAASRLLLEPVPATVRPGGVVYECSACGSGEVDFGLKVRRDPVTDNWLVESVDTAGHFCLGCGTPDCDPVPRPLTAAEHKRARAELQRLAKNHAARAADVRRVLAFVAGARR